MIRLGCRFLILFAFFVFPLRGEVLRIEVESRKDILSGKPFGLAGPFEKLMGKIYFAVDPENSANRIITDIDKAPRNSAGKVEFSSDFFLVKPKDVTKGNGVVLYEVSNRGGKGMLGFFNRASGSLNPDSEAEFGDTFLLTEGFTLLWLGWQFDVPLRDGLMRLYTPVATDNGQSIQGLVRSDFVVNEKVYFHSLADRNHIAYAAADPEDPVNILTVRDSVEGERRTVPRDRWKFARVEEGRAVPDRQHVYLESGFEPHKIYEVVYKSENPPLVGLGPAAVRDTISLLKYGSPENLVIPRGAIRHAIAFGISQSGRFLRTFLYYGFNESEGRRKVFDGVLAHVAGAGRGSFNHRFAQPSRDGHPYLNFFYPTDIFPFSDVAQADPETGLKDGLLVRSGMSQYLPKIFYTNSSYEYWGRAASLIHTSIDGRADAPLLEEVRIYLFAGGQHGPAPFPPRKTIGEQPNNPNDFRWPMRSLLLSLSRWIRDGTPPPESRYPRVKDQTLVKPEELRFPKIPGVRYLPTLHKAYRADYGPEFRSRGIVSLEPPKIGSAFPMKVPQVDADGNEIAGIKTPEVSVPLATYTGWNLFNPLSGPSNVMSSMQGSYIPFARTRKERERAGDPRTSIEERYSSREHYLGLVSKAGLELIEQGFLLRQDLAEIVRQAERHWNYLHGATP